MIAQIIVLTLLVANIAINAYEYGNKKQTRKQYITEWVSMLLLMGLLIWGGYFNVLFK